MKTLWTYLKDDKRDAVLSPLFKLLEASFDLLVPLVVAAIVDRGVGEGDTAFLWRMGGVLLALAALGLGFSVIAQFFAARAAAGCAHRLRKAVFSRIQALSQAQADALGVSALVTRMTSDIAQVQAGVNLSLRLLLRSPFIVFGAMGMALAVDAASGFWFVLVIPVLGLAVYGVMRFSMPLFRKAQDALDSVSRQTREGLTGVRVIRAFGREAERAQAFDQAHLRLTDAQIRAGRVSGLLNPLTWLVVSLGTAALLQTGAGRVFEGALSRGALVALVNYMAQILVELVKMANLIVNISRALACMGRVEALLQTPLGMDAPAQTQGVPDSAAAAVAFEDVSVAYPGGRGEALTGVNLLAMPGETIGIIGGTGSGKSTLVNLIPRLYDVTRGRVLVEGVDVRAYALAHLREKIGVVPQRARLFRGTLAQNLRWGGDASQNELEAALAAAQATDAEARLGGLDGEIAQDGGNLSGGQRQRLTIARALVKRPGILILDDSASALDMATDLRLRRALRALPWHPTVFIVSQRAASVMRADRILVLEDGRVAGLGDHETLLASCPVYREIYESQFPKEAI